MQFALEQLTLRKTLAATLAMFAVTFVAVAATPAASVTSIRGPQHLSSARDPALAALSAAFPGLQLFQRDDLPVVGTAAGGLSPTVRFGAVAGTNEGTTTPSIPSDPIHTHGRGPMPAAASAYGYGDGPIRDLVIGIFTRIAGPAQVPMAMCVANRESRFHPSVMNPTSRAAGIFQWLPHSWWVYSHRYGLGDASPYDPVANITVAAHVVAEDGWTPWAGPGC